MVSIFQWLAKYRKSLFREQNQIAIPRKIVPYNSDLYHGSDLRNRNRRVSTFHIGFLYPILAAHRAPEGFRQTTNRNANSLFSISLFSESVTDTRSAYR